MVGGAHPTPSGPARFSLLPQRIASENPLLDRPALDQVLLDEAADALGRHAVIPRPLGVDDHRRAVDADAQTADLAAVAGVLSRRQATVLQGMLEGLPGR